MRLDTPCALETPASPVVALDPAYCSACPLLISITGSAAVGFTVSDAATSQLLFRVGGDVGRASLTARMLLKAKNDPIAEVCCQASKHKSAMDITGTAAGQRLLRLRARSKGAGTTVSTKFGDLLRSCNWRAKLEAENDSETGVISIKRWGLYSTPIARIHSPMACQERLVEVAPGVDVALIALLVIAYVQERTADKEVAKFNGYPRQGSSFRSHHRSI